MIIIVDDREDPERIRAYIEYFEALGYSVKIAHNPTGDLILYKNDIPIVAIEYKTAKDFLKSIIDNRVFNQAKDQSENFSKHYVFIESDIWEYVFKSSRYDAHIINNVEGAVMSLNQITTVVECRNQKQAFHRMHLAFQKATDGRNRQLTKLPKGYDSLVGFLMSGNDGIGEVIATSIVKELKLKSLEDCFNLNMTRLCLVEGVGEKTAEKVLLKVYGDEWENKQK